MKNILFSNSVRCQNWGGGEKWMLHAACSLPPEEFRTYVVCRKNSILKQRAIQTGLPTFGVSFRNSLDFASIYAVYQILRQQKIDLVICCTLLDVKLTGMAAKLANIPVVSRQGLALFQDKLKYRLLIKNFTSSLITNTLSIQKQYESYSWFPKNHIRVIYNAVETVPSFPPDRKLQEKYRITADEKVILASGRLSSQKGFLFLIEAARLAQTAQKRWKFLIMGEGDQKKQLQEKIQEYRLRNIELVGFQQNTNAHYQLADLFILTSLSEGTPNVVLEAMANRCPVIATSVNGVKEIIENGINGILIPPQNPEAIYQALCQVFNNPALSKSLAKNGYQTVREHFSTREFTKNFTTYLLHVLHEYEKRHYQNA